MKEQIQVSNLELCVYLWEACKDPLIMVISSNLHGDTGRQVRLVYAGSQGRSICHDYPGFLWL